MDKAKKKPKKKLSKEEQLEKLKGAIHEVNKERAIKSAPRFSLRDVLETLDTKTLKDLITMSRPKPKPKVKATNSEMIEALLMSLVNEEYLKLMIDLVADHEWTLLNDVTLGKTVDMGDSFFFAENFYFLLRSEIVQLYYYDGKFIFACADEIRQALSKIITSKFKEEWELNWLINRYAMSCVELYGVIKIADLVSIFNAQNNNKIDAKKAEEIVGRFSRAEYGYVHIDDMVVSDLYGDGLKSFALDLLREQGGKPFYIPEKEELLKYENDLYFEETKETEAFRKFLLGIGKMDEDEAEDCLHDIIQAHKAELGFGSKHIFDILSKYKVTAKVREAEMHLLGSLIMELTNATRIWANRGYAPKEMRAVLTGMNSKTSPIQKPMPATAVRQQERNDPCDCGSGKKFKSCCLIKDWKVIKGGKE